MPPPFFIEAALEKIILLQKTIQVLTSLGIQTCWLPHHQLLSPHRQDKHLHGEHAGEREERLGRPLIFEQGQLQRGEDLDPPQI